MSQCYIVQHLYKGTSMVPTPVYFSKVGVRRLRQRGDTAYRATSNVSPQLAVHLQNAVVFIFRPRWLTLLLLRLTAILGLRLSIFTIWLDN